MRVRCCFFAGEQGEAKVFRACVAGKSPPQRGGVGACYFFLVQERSNQESELGCSLRDLPSNAKTVDASRHQCFCEGEQIQILRWRFDKKTPTRGRTQQAKAKVLATCDAPNNKLNFKQNGIAKNLANS
jgi:hypothetical protein